MALIPLNLVFEDQISECVMCKIALETNRFRIANTYSEGGFGYIKKNLKGFNEASRTTPYFLLVDLDRVDCAPIMVKEWINFSKHPNLIFRIAIREIEAWILADIEGFSEFLGISKANFHRQPEELNDPKNELFRIVRKSKKRNIREDILPKDEFARIGPNYNGRLIQFVNEFWLTKRASENSPSLMRTVQILSDFDFKHY